MFVKPKFYTETNSLYGSYDPHDSWDRPDTETHITGIKLVWAGEDEYNAFEVPDDSDGAYIVFALYSTGDSFGHDTGWHVVLEVTNDKHLVASIVEAAQYCQGSSFEVNGKEYHAHWNGYFEKLESIETVYKHISFT